MHWICGPALKMYPIELLSAAGLLDGPRACSKDLLTGSQKPSASERPSPGQVAGSAEGMQSSQQAQAITWAPTQATHAVTGANTAEPVIAPVAAKRSGPDLWTVIYDKDSLEYKYAQQLGLCLHCAQPGHICKKCPAKASEQPPRRIIAPPAWQPED